MAEIKLTKRIKYAEDVYKELTERAGFPLDLASDFLNSIPDADAVEVVHGRWVQPDFDFSDYWQCTACGVEWFMTDDGDWNYCPNCGAKMDAQED